MNKSSPVTRLEGVVNDIMWDFDISRNDLAVLLRAQAVRLELLEDRERG